MKRDELEGGFLQVANGKVYKGTVRERESKKVHWTCNHIHSRPEYNARWQHDDEMVWEYSALNCGRIAHGQWPQPKGNIGLVGSDDISFTFRDDVRFAHVDNDDYVGRIALSNQGERILRVSHEVQPITGVVLCDHPGPGGVNPPRAISDTDLEKWATAAWLLRGGVWGVVFQDPNVDMDAEEPLDIALIEILGADYLKNRDRRIVVDEKDTWFSEASGTGISRKGASPKPEFKKNTKPHIRIGRRDGRRIFEVVGEDGDVVDEFVHRGLAVEALKKVKR